MLSRQPAFVVAAEASGSMKDRQGSVGILADLDVGLDEMRAQRAFGNLQLEPVEADAIVVADASIFLDAEDLGQIEARDRDEGRALLLGRNREARVVRRDVGIPDERVGGLDGSDAGQRQLLGQPVLQGLERPLRATARLGRIGRDMLDPQMRQGAADLRRLIAIDLSVRLGRVKIMAAAIRVETQRKSMPAKHFQQSPERRIRAFLRDQKGRKDRARRVVQRHDQIERRLTGQPCVRRAVLMQHHAGKRSARALAPMRAPSLGLFQKTLRMQKRFRPGVAPREIVPRHQVLVKMLRREAAVALAIQSLHLMLPVDRNPPARRFAQPPIQQPGFAIVFEPLPPAPKRPLIDPKQFRRFDLVQFRRLVAAHYARELDHTNPLKGFRPAHL